MSSSAELRRGHINQNTSDIEKLIEVLNAQIDATKYVNYQMLNGATPEQLEKLLEETRGGKEQLESLERILEKQIEASKTE
ncbi:MAG: hypothetical protein IJE43_01835 [Alphaproteobacteria bacterium]|nr:hypothetical protein [Alphaproteobacteria bacterium]MBQ3512523.1 hypothetical protein [Lachnospiraceae bacterium]